MLRKTRGSEIRLCDTCAAGCMAAYPNSSVIVPSICDLPPAKRVCISFGSRTRNYLAAVPTVDSKI